MDPMDLRLASSWLVLNPPNQLLICSSWEPTFPSFLRDYNPIFWGCKTCKTCIFHSFGGPPRVSSKQPRFLSHLFWSHRNLSAPTGPSPVLGPRSTGDLQCPTPSEPASTKVPFAHRSRVFIGGIQPESDRKWLGNPYVYIYILYITLWTYVRVYVQILVLGAIAFFVFCISFGCPKWKPTKHVGV